MHLSLSISSSSRTLQLKNTNEQLEYTLSEMESKVGAVATVATGEAEAEIGGHELTVDVMRVDVGWKINQAKAGINTIRSQFHSPLDCAFTYRRVRNPQDRDHCRSVIFSPDLTAPCTLRPAL